MTSAVPAQQHQQYNRGILPSETLNALDYLVDRINASSGHVPNTSTDNSSSSPPPLRALLVGTNEGVGLSRSLGTAHSSQLGASHEFSFSGNMSEEVLSSIETVWATLVSAASPHVMASAATNAAGGSDDNGMTTMKHNQPPHPLLSPLQLGSTVKIITACYDNATLIHVHFPPLVVTFIASPEVNLGSVRNMAIPKLKILLEPVRRALVRSRGKREGAAAANANVNQMAMQQQQQQRQMQQQFSQGQMMQQGYPQQR